MTGRPVAIIGGGGHASVVEEMLRLLNDTADPQVALPDPGAARGPPHPARRVCAPNSSRVEINK